MEIIAFVVSGGTPMTGLTPDLDIWETDGTVITSSQDMTEIAGGFYKYDFTTFNPSKRYVFRVSGGQSVAAAQRWIHGSNEDYLDEMMSDKHGDGNWRGGAGTLEWIDTDWMIPKWDRSEVDKVLSSMDKLDKISKEINKKIDNFKVSQKAAVENSKKDILKSVNAYIETLDKAKTTIIDKLEDTSIDSKVQVDEIKELGLQHIKEMEDLKTKWEGFKELVSTKTDIKNLDTDLAKLTEITIKSLPNEIFDQMYNVYNNEQDGTREDASGRETEKVEGIAGEDTDIGDKGKRTIPKIKHPIKGSRGKGTKTKRNKSTTKPKEKST